MTLGERILKLRKERHMSQEELAEYVEVSKQSVSKWELDKAVPNVEKVIRLCDVFDISTDYLLKGETVHMEPEVNEKRIEIQEEERNDQDEEIVMTTRVPHRKRRHVLLGISICVTVVMTILTYQAVLIDTIGSRENTERKLAVVGEVHSQLTLADVTAYSDETGFVTRRLWLDLKGVHEGDYIYCYMDSQNPARVMYPYHFVTCVALISGLGIALVCSCIFAWLAWKNRKLRRKNEEENAGEGEADD